MATIIDYPVWRKRAATGEQAGLQYLWARDPSPLGPFAPGGDCSGWCHWLYGAWLDWVYPQTTVLWNMATHLGRIRPVNAAKPGDMLIHRAGYLGAPVGHVAAYIGDEGSGPQTIEAHSSHTTPQVGRFPAFQGRLWEASIAVPEIAPDVNVVARFVAACRQTTIGPGAQGPVVRFLQQELGDLVIDGLYGPLTEGAVSAFQAWFQGAQQHLVPPVTDPRFLLPVTGICDPHTWAALALKAG